MFVSASSYLYTQVKRIMGLKRGKEKRFSFVGTITLAMVFAKSLIICLEIGMLVERKTIYNII